MNQLFMFVILFVSTSLPGKGLQVQSLVKIRTHFRRKEKKRLSENHRDRSHPSPPAPLHPGTPNPPQPLPEPSSLMFSSSR